jgi:hypothetical protein
MSTPARTARCGPHRKTSTEADWPLLGSPKAVVPFPTSAAAMLVAVAQKQTLDCGVGLAALSKANLTRDQLCAFANGLIPHRK